MGRVDHIALGHFKTQLRLFMKTVGLFDLHHWPGPGDGCRLSVEGTVTDDDRSCSRLLGLILLFPQFLQDGFKPIGTIKF